VNATEMSPKEREPMEYLCKRIAGEKNAQEVKKLGLELNNLVSPRIEYLCKCISGEKNSKRLKKLTLEWNDLVSAIVKSVQPECKWWLSIAALEECWAWEWISSARLSMTTYRLDLPRGASVNTGAAGSFSDPPFLEIHGRSGSVRSFLRHRFRREGCASQAICTDDVLRYTQDARWKLATTSEAIHVAGRSVSAVKNQSQNIGPKTSSAIQPKPQTKPEPMKDWQERFECFLLLNAKRSTFRRYARAMDRFFKMNQGNTYGYQFLRPVIIDYAQARLAEGASVSTVRLQMSAVRGLFDFMIAMNAFDVIINPARNVKVKKPISPLLSSTLRQNSC
jgi:hypothetical protein